MKSIQLFLVGLGCGLGALASCGDNDELICGPGTFHDGESCSPTDPNDAKPPVTVASPVAGRRRTVLPAVTIRSDEPARIIYTTDGSDPSPHAGGEPSPVLVPLTAPTTTIKYFGIDANGNVEEMHTEVWETDSVGPDAVTGLAVSAAGNTANVTWTNPTDADYAGTLVVRATGLIDAAPVAGKTYAAGDTLSPSLTVVSTGTGTQVSDASRPTGPVRYIAWPYDDLGNYGAPRAIEGEVGTVSTAATFTYNTNNNALTETVTPASIDLTGTTADYAVTTVTLHLQVKNVTSHYFQNPKILVTSATNGVFTGSAGTADGSPFVKLGNGYFAPGETRNVDLTFTTVVATTTLTVELALGHHPSFYGSNSPNQAGSSTPRRFVDTGSGQASTGMNMYLRGFNNRAQGLSRQGRLVAHRFLDLPTTHGYERWDMTTQQPVGGQLLGKHILSMVTDGIYTYVLVTRTKHSGQLTLMRLDERLLITAELALSDRSEDHAGFASMAISADRTTIAVPRRSDVVLVDLKSFTVRDMDPSTSVVDGIDVGGTEPLRAVTFRSGTTELVAVTRYGELSFISIGSTGPTVTTTDLGVKTHALLTAPDGRVWIATNNDLQIYTPSTNAITTSAYPNGAMALKLVDGNRWVLRSARTSLDRVDDTGAVQQTLSIGNTGYGHWIDITK